MPKKVSNRDEFGLLPHHRLFVDMVLAGKTQVESYMTAFPNRKSEKGVAQAASKLLQRPEIEAYCREKRRTLIERLDLTQEDIRRNMMQLISYGMHRETRLERRRPLIEGERRNPETRALVEEQHGPLLQERERMRDADLARKCLEFLGRDAGMCTDESDQGRGRPAILIIQDP